MIINIKPTTKSVIKEVARVAACMGVVVFVGSVVQGAAARAFGYAE
ncbi:hypothetical protein LUCX_118 [Xanthomonas phage vB_XciM_LucasX]|nr:hypothetical protein LUCX_118 [Xanthomonas phage vB_XciM_LucasX]